MPHVIDRAAQQIRRQRDQLQSGQAPPPRIKNPLQRAAARALMGFLAVMLALTLVSRAADGIAMARVKTDTMKSGVLNGRLRLGGVFRPLGDEEILLPGDLRVEQVCVQAGQRVAAGDLLLKLDEAALKALEQALTRQLAAVTVKLENARAAAPESDTAVEDAQRTLAQRQQDYDRLLQRLELQQSREDEDCAGAHQAAQDAEAALEKAVQQTRAALLESAQAAVDAAQEALAATQESARDAIQAAQDAYDTAAKQDKRQSEALDKAIDRHNRALDTLDAAKAALHALTQSPDADPDAVAAAQARVDAAQAAYDAAQAALEGLGGESADLEKLKTALTRTREKWDAQCRKDTQKLEEAQAKLAQQQSRTDYSEEAAVKAAQSALDAALAAVKAAERGLVDSDLSQQEQRLAAQRGLEEAQRALEKAQAQAAESARADVQSSRQQQVEILELEAEAARLRGQIQALAGPLADAGRVTAPLAGTVQSVLGRGEATAENQPVAVLSRSDQGFVLEAETDSRTAEQIKVGDSGSVTYTQGGTQAWVDGTVQSIGLPDEKGKVTLRVSLPDGSYPVEGSGELTITWRGGKQYNCLPLSALRTDSSGDYVLILQEKNTVLGVEQTVARVPITVEDRDSQTMVVSGAVPYDAQVVTGTSKPIEEGDRVRLETD